MVEPRSSCPTSPQAKIQTLLDKYSTVSQLNSERCLQLERAQSLASQFWETYEELWPWLQETRASFTQLPPPAIEYEALRQQQEELRVSEPTEGVMSHMTHRHREGSDPGLGMA